MTPRELEIALIKAVKPDDFFNALKKTGIEQVRYNYNHDFKEVEFQINNPNSGYMAYAQVLSLLSDRRHRWLSDYVVDQLKPEFKHRDSIFHVDVDVLDKSITTSGKIHISYIKQNDPIYFSCKEFEDCELPELIDKAHAQGVIAIKIPFIFENETCSIGKIEFIDKSGLPINFTEKTLWSPYAIADEILAKYVYRNPDSKCKQGLVSIDVVDRKHEIDCYGEIVEFKRIEEKTLRLTGNKDALLFS